MTDERRDIAATAAKLARRTYEDLPMKPDVHRQYHLIKVVMTDWTEFFTRSSYGKAGDTLHLDIDPTTHPAWTGGSRHLVDRGGRLSRFNSRFGDLAFGKQ